MKRVTKEQFDAYRKIQFSGRYNMISEGRAVRRAAGLDRETYIAILKNYSALAEKWPRKETT